MLKGLGGLGDMGKMMKAAQEMQTKMTDLQEELQSVTVVGESGAGLVKATATAKGELIGLDIDPSIFSPDEKEIVEDLILAAIKDAQMKASTRSNDEMRQLTEAMGLPADMKLPF
ncbi:MAG: YbaB/EbfC family nucleoid-associated protein [Paracoccaceae bacterium]